MKDLTTFALLGVIGCASSAWAQTADQVVDEADVTIATFGPSVRGYASRALTDVYAVGLPSQTGGSFMGSGTVAYDDVTFGAGTSAPITLVGASIGVVRSVSAPPNSPVYVRILFYPDHDNTGVNARPYSGTPIVWNLGAVPGGPVPPIVLDSSLFTSLGDRTCGVYVELFSDAAMTTYADDWQVARRGNLLGPLLVGTSDYFGWMGPTTGATAECIRSNDRSGGTHANNRSTYLTLTAAPRGTCSVDFNQDGDVGTDADIEAFFACLAGNCCPLCLPSADFNGDGDVGTDADIESFFRVLSGGQC